MNSELKNTLIEMCRELIREQEVLHDPVLENAVQIKINAIRKAISLVNQFEPHRTKTDPPTEERDGRYVRAWNPCRPSWISADVWMVANNPKSFPYWLPETPSPEAGE